MRSAIRIKTITIFCLLVYFILNTFTCIAQDNVLIIDITNNDDYSIEEIEENKPFSISVYTYNETSILELLTNVNIEFNNEIYTINESGKLIINSSYVNDDTFFTIIAAKEGYVTSNATLKVLNIETKKLEIVPLDRWTINAGEKFSIKVTDDQGNPVSGALVAIENFGDKKTTGDEGRVWLTAPENTEKIRIIAQKDGYEQDVISIEINNPPPWWIEFIKSPYFLISIASILLISAIVFVTLKQKKSVYQRAKEISDEKTLKKYGLETKNKQSFDEKHGELGEESTLKKNVRIQSVQDPKVEEIRISRPRKEKEVIPVETEEDKMENVINRKKNQTHDYDWFEGTDDIRYEIDKLTGEVDEEGADKWFEGVDNLKEKIDEKVKKKDKKKNIEQEN